LGKDQGSDQEKNKWPPVNLEKKSTEKTCSEGGGPNDNPTSQITPRLYSTGLEQIHSTRHKIRMSLLGNVHIIVFDEIVEEWLT